MGEHELREVRKKLEEHEKRISALEEIIKTKPEKKHAEEKGIGDLLLALKDEGFFK
jgi:hypothetical protein